MATEGGGRWVVPAALRAGWPLFVGQGVVLVSGFALNVALVRWIFRDDPAAMGRYGVLSEALQWITVVALMGMPAAVLRFVPAHPARTAAILRTASAITIGLALAVACVASFPEPLGRMLAGDEWRSLATYGFRAVPLCAICVVTASLHARGRLGRKAAVEAVERVAVLAGGVFFALRWGFDGLLWGMLAGSCVGWGFAAAAAFRKGDAAAAPHPSDSGDAALDGSLRDSPGDAFPARDLFRVGAPQMAISLLETMRPLVLLRLAQEFVDGPALGHLATAKAFALPLVIAPELLAQALFPGMHGPAGEHAHLEGERRRFVREILVVGAVVCAVYGAAAAWLLPVLGGGKYAPAVPALLAFLPGVLAQGATAHAGYVLLVRDRLGQAALVSALGLAVTVFVAAVLVPGTGPFGGAVGGAVAMSVGLIVRAAVLLRFARG